MVKELGPTRKRKPVSVTPRFFHVSPSDRIDMAAPPKKVYGVALPPGLVREMDVDSDGSGGGGDVVEDTEEHAADDEEEEEDDEWEAPQDITTLHREGKSDFFGIGYHPHDDAPEFQGRGGGAGASSSGNKNRVTIAEILQGKTVTVGGFGTGVLEDETDDTPVYSVDC